MKRDRAGGQRSNWLLIKHADKHARRNGDALLKKSRSVASGRTLPQIAAGKARTSDAVHANGDQACRACEKRIALRVRRSGTRRRRRDSCCRSSRASSSARPPKPAGVMKSSSTATACRCVVDGKAILRTRKGLDWTVASPRLPRLAGSCRTPVDGEICALDARGVPSFAALQAALTEEDTHGSCTSSSTCSTRTVPICGRRASRTASGGSPSSWSRNAARATALRGAFRDSQRTPC